MKKRLGNISNYINLNNLIFQPYKGLNPECSKIFTQRED
nr:MAG TPA: hypothetical protein [Caudoviricetes sp.]